MKVQSVFALILVAGGLAFPPGPARAVDGDPPSSSSPELEAGRKAIESRDWGGAIKSLSAAERRDSRNADVHNLLGYAYRNSGQLEPALKHYQRALQLNPRHLGAHEYIGEAYLMAKNLAKAEEHLAALKNFCLRVCGERDDLEKKVADYKRNGGK